MLKQLIYDQRMEAMRASDKNKSNLLGTLLGELDRYGKNPSDEIALKVIKKMSEGCKICGEIEESKILETYLPKTLSVRDLFNTIREICDIEKITDKKQMGLVMKSLKDKYPNMYDGKLASRVVTKVLARIEKSAIGEIQ